jgi:hypothetical protein
LKYLIWNYTLEIKDIPVMPANAGIHDYGRHYCGERGDVDDRDKPGHDDGPQPIDLADIVSTQAQETIGM